MYCQILKMAQQYSFQERRGFVTFQAILNYANSRNYQIVKRMKALLKIMAGSLEHEKMQNLQTSS